MTLALLWCHWLHLFYEHLSFFLPLVFEEKLWLYYLVSIWNVTILLKLSCESSTQVTRGSFFRNRLSITCPMSVYPCNGTAELDTFCVLAATKEHLKIYPRQQRQYVQPNTEKKDVSWFDEQFIVRPITFFNCWRYGLWGLMLTCVEIKFLNSNRVWIITLFTLLNHFRCTIVSERLLKCNKECPSRKHILSMCSLKRCTWWCVSERTGTKHERSCTAMVGQ